MYGSCADWLEVVLQLNRPAYDRILGRWRTAHARRRNLWEALRSKRLPLEVDAGK